jgi:4-diphosphocytidyl-2-C-methyl-D-erythritol kinase
VRLVAQAPGKVNLSLLVGPLREDGRHEVATLIESVSLADELSVEVGGDVRVDEVVCPGVSGPNIVSRAISGLRARGWEAPAVRVTIRKFVPVAGGMGGGSADAAAFLRVADSVASVGASAVAELAAELGADVPSQLDPGLAVGTGAGELVQRRAPLAPHAYLIVPLPHLLSAGEVYREADRLELPRGIGGFGAAADELGSAVAPGAVLPGALIVNDLAPAAVSLCPPIEDALSAVGEAGADQVLVSGSGPTVAGLFWGEDALDRAGAGASALASRYPGTTSAVPVGEEFGIPVRM